MKLKVGDDVYEYDPAALTVREATQIKLQTGMKLPEFVGGGFDDPQVVQAIIWLCRYRDGEYKLRIDEVDAPLQDIDILPDEEPDEEAPTVATLPDDNAGSPTISSGPTGSSPNGVTGGSSSPKSGTSRRGSKTT